MTGSKDATPKRDVGCAFVGAGSVAQLHARAIGRQSDAWLAGAWQPDRAGLAAFCEKTRTRAYDSLEALLADSKVQAVHVLTPVDFHVDIAIRCLDAGKHVLVEKPLAATRTELARLRAAAAAHPRLVCMPAHNYIYAPAIKRMRQMVRDGRLGTVGSLWVLYNLFHNSEIAALHGGPFRAVCVHHVYSLLYLLGRPLGISAISSKLSDDPGVSEHQVMLVATLPAGAIANLWASWAANDNTSDPWTLCYKLLGSKGSASYSWSEAIAEAPDMPGWNFVDYVESFELEVRHFLARCIVRGEPPLSTLDDAGDAMAVIEAAQRSLALHGQAVEIAYD